jgi:hypothetical protein
MGLGSPVEQPGEQCQRLLAWIALEPMLRGHPPGAPVTYDGCVRHRLTRCRRGGRESAFDVALVGGTLTGSDTHARRLEDLQLDLGEGP